MVADNFQREIRLRLENCIDGSESVGDVSAWLAGELAQQPGMTLATEAFAYAARLRFAEHDRGDLSDGALREALLDLLKTTVERYGLDQSGPDLTVHSATASDSVVTRSFASGVRTRPAGAPA